MPRTAQSRQEPGRGGACMYCTKDGKCAAASCSRCLMNYGLFKRRHHCRACGGNFCGDCTTHRVRLSEVAGGKELVRVCGACYSRHSQEAVWEAETLVARRFLRVQNHPCQLDAPVVDAIGWRRAPYKCCWRAKCGAVNVLVTAIKCGAEPPLEITSEAEAGGVGDCILCLKHPFLWPTLAAQYDLPKQRLLTLRPWSKRGSLRDRLHRADPAVPHVVKYAGEGKPLPMHEICRYSRQILEAVHYLLNRGLRVAHMHSGNVLLDQHNNAFLAEVIELQLFHLPHSPGKEGVLLLESVAPCAAAVIGFGYLLFEMAVGRPPFVGELVSGGGVNTQYNLPMPVVEILDSIFVPPLPIKPASLPTIQELLDRPEMRGVRLMADVAFITQPPPAGMAAEIIERANCEPSDQILLQDSSGTPSGSYDVNMPPKAGTSTNEHRRSNSEIPRPTRASGRAQRPPKPPRSSPSSTRSSRQQSTVSKPFAEESPAHRVCRSTDQVVAVATATACAPESAVRTSPAGSSAATTTQSSNCSRGRKCDPSSARVGREQPRASSLRKDSASGITGPKPPSKAPIASSNPHTCSYNNLFGDDVDEYHSDEATQPPLITPEQRNPTAMARNAYQVHMSQMGASWGFTPPHLRHTAKEKLSTVAALTQAFGESSLDAQSQADHEFLLFGDVVDALPSSIKAKGVSKKKRNKEQRHRTSDGSSSSTACLPLLVMSGIHTKQEDVEVESDANTKTGLISNRRNRTIASSSRQHGRCERLLDHVEMPPGAARINNSDGEEACIIEKHTKARVQSPNDHQNPGKPAKGRTKSKYKMLDGRQKDSDESLGLFQNRELGSEL